MSLTHYRARVAALTRSRTPDDPELVAARQWLETMRLEGLAREIGNVATRLTGEQRSRIIDIIRAGGLT